MKTRFKLGFAAIVCLGLWLGYVNLDAHYQKKEQEIISMYQQKNNTTLIYMLSEFNPHTDLVDKIQAVIDVDPKNKSLTNEKLYQAKLANEAWSDRLMQLIQLCDPPDQVVSAENSLGTGPFLYRNASKLQSDLMFAVNGANIDNVLNIINYLYHQKKRPEGITANEKNLLKKIVAELRQLEKNYSGTFNQPTRSRLDAQDEPMMESVKRAFLGSLEPSLSRIGSLSKGYQEEVNHSSTK